MVGFSPVMERWWSNEHLRSVIVNGSFRYSCCYHYFC